MTYEKQFKVAENCISELKWVAGLADIDHDICDVADDAISVIKILKGQLLNARDDINTLLEYIPEDSDYWDEE